jgi:hypothetical protein
MNTAGTYLIRAKEVQAIEKCAMITAYRKLKEVFINLNKKRFTKISKVTIKEYCEHYGYELADFITQFNTQFKTNITI